MSTPNNNNTSLPFNLRESDRFGGENYPNWEILMVANGAPRGLDIYWNNLVNIPLVTPIAPPTTTPTIYPPTLTTTPLSSLTPSYTEYVHREAVAMSSIILNLVDITGSGVDPKGKSFNAWAHLKIQYGSPTDRTRNRRERDLDANRFVDGGKVSGEGGHIEKMRTLRMLANEAGANITDDRFITKLLDSFPESWSPVISSLYNCKMLSDVINTITSHGEFLMRNNTSNVPSSDVVKALEARVFALQAEMNSLRSNRSSNPRNESKSNLICSNSQCGKKGHLAADCFQAGGGKQGQYPDWWKGKKTATLPSANTATTAPITSTASGSVLSGNHYALSASLGIDTLDINKLVQENESALERVSNYSLAAGDLPSMSSCTFADSGASATFFKNREYFVNFKELNRAEGKSSKEGVNFVIGGVGDVEMRVIQNNKVHFLTFKDSIYAPNITSNLLSIGKMDLLGWKVLFGDKKARFFDPNMFEVFEATLKDGLYLVNGSFSSNVPTALVARSLKSPGDIVKWHRRFAHFGASRINTASKLVNGLELTNESPVGKCEDCIIGNQKRRPFDADVIPETIALRRTNIDIWGPSRVTSAGGSKYAMKFHDSATSHRQTYFLANRLAETTLSALKSYKLQSERITGKTMVYIRSDNAPEFKSKLWSQWFKELGLIFDPTPTYSSASNGTAERSIGVTTGAVRVMLLDAELPTKWWAEAWASADYIENLLPSARNPGKIPEEEWTREKQDVGHLRVWGCIAYAHIPKEKGGSKLDNRGIKGRLIGFVGRGVYRVLIEETEEVVKSRDVIFEEGLGHRTLSTEGEYIQNSNNGDFNYDFLIDNNDIPTPVSTNIQNLTDKSADPPSTPPTDSPSIPPTSSIRLPPRANPPNTRATLPRDIQAPVFRRSSRQVKPSRHLIQSQEYLQRENVANELTEAWASDSNVPAIEDEDEDETTIALSASSPSVPEPQNRFVPKNFNEAWDPSRRYLWQPAMVSEVDRWDARDVVTAVPREPHMRAIGVLWVLDLKLDGQGELLKRRARCVVKGFTQKLGLHYFESFAAVSRYESVRALIAVIASMGLDFWLIDFVGAYLNAKPQGDNFLEIPPGFENHYSLPNSVDTVLKMNLTIYGTMDGANNWFHELNNAYINLGHKQSRADPCIRVHYSPLGKTITSTYTDDVLGGSSTKKAGELVRKELSEKYEIKDFGQPNNVLGMTVVKNDDGSISLHQQTLIRKAIDTHGMKDSKPKHTPFPSDSNLADSQPLPIPQKDAIFMLDKEYRGVLGMLNHISNGTRPDISFSVNVLLRYASDPRPIHWRHVQHILSYLNTTISKSITYGRHSKDLKPIGFSDSSYADDHNSRKSTAGYVFTMAGGPVSWRSKGQKKIALSTGEAEYVALSEAGKQAKWMSSWLTEVDMPNNVPLIVKCDNSAAISLTENTSGHSRIKHLDVKHHWIRDAVAADEILVQYIPSEENLADIFTKALARPQHEKLVKLMGLD